MPRLVKEVAIELDRPRKLRLDMGAALRFKRLTTTPERPKGISLLRGDLGEEELDEEVYVALVFACLAHEDPELSIDTLAAAITFADVVRSIEVIFDELVPAFLPKAEEPAEEPAADDDERAEEPAARESSEEAAPFPKAV